MITTTTTPAPTATLAKARQSWRAFLVSGATMSSRYEGMSAKDADDLMVGIIGLLVADAMDEARAMTQEEWDVRDASYLPHYFASAIFYAVQNRLMGVP